MTSKTANRYFFPTEFNVQNERIVLYEFCKVIKVTIVRLERWYKNE